jgi:hypothetical protein
MPLENVDRKQRFITVRLKGARDQRRVPVTDGGRTGTLVHPHLLRHTLGCGVHETTGNIKVAQEILGYSHQSTTADLYLRVDQHAMVAALVAAKSRTERATKQHSWSSTKAAQYAFDYDDETAIKDRNRESVLAVTFSRCEFC